MVREADDRAVVVGVDGSATGMEALRYAAGAARSRGMWLLVVHAYQLPPQASAVTTAGLSAAALASAYRVTTDALSQVRVPVGVDVETTAELTTPLLMLQRLSGQAAMIVLGQHDANPSDLGLGRPVGSSVAAGALCPIVIVPPHWSHDKALSRSVVVGLDAETALLPSGEKPLVAFRVGYPVRQARPSPRRAIGYASCSPCWAAPSS